LSTSNDLQAIGVLANLCASIASARSLEGRERRASSPQTFAQILCAKAARDDAAMLAML